jgi:dTDP-4-dehydrorhamnose reductase
MKTIWVTGSKGQLGTELSLQYKKLAGYNFVFTDIDELDLTHEKAVVNFFETNKPDLIVNCAAYTAVDKAEEESDKAFLINRDVPKLLSEICKKFNSTLIHISTDYVFDGESCRPYNESDPTNPQSVYGQTKLEGEEFVLLGEKNLVIRTSWLYSAHGSNFMKTMIRLGKEKKEIGVVFDQVGTPTSAAELADAILSIIDDMISSSINKPGIYHYSNEGVCSWYDFAIEIMKVAGLSCKVKPITSDQYPAAAKRPAFSVFNKKKIKESFNFEIPYWKESLEKVLLSLNNK